ncbi:zinc ribbon domain-containing protein [Chloroflexus sp. MS-CIW-1]|nr:zinc ribbon domain-containing protein [Chloroflexus sp. MS-CIW-1]MDN5270704.1 zinc ribbon domain-containing protein [Chloroflexus sp. MS-CIW-1]
MYEYSCLDCTHQFEQLRPMNAADQNIVCPFCQSTHVQRRLSLFATHSRGEAATTNTTSSSASGCSCSACSCGPRS